MLVIRLSRTGKKNTPSYRLVAADKKRAVKGKYLEILGFYNPISKPKVFQADKEKVESYTKQGAQISVTALNLLCDYGYLPKNRKIKIVHARKIVAEKDKAEKPAAESTTEETAEKPKAEQSEAPTEEAKETATEEKVATETAEETTEKPTVPTA